VWVLKTAKDHPNTLTVTACHPKKDLSQLLPAGLSWRSIIERSVSVSPALGKGVVVDRCDLRRDGDVLAGVEVARSRRTRRRGLLGRDGIDGVLVLTRARQVHTIGMRFSIDVAWCDRRGTVVRVATLQPNRVGAWVRRSRNVLEAEAGRFEAWGLRVGDRLTWDDSTRTCRS
jgi:uncharacterized membrane protein (UPF0127 family)